MGDTVPGQPPEFLTPRDDVICLAPSSIEQLLYHVTVVLVLLWLRAIWTLVFEDWRVGKKECLCNIEQTNGYHQAGSASSVEKMTSNF